MPPADLLAAVAGGLLVMLGLKCAYWKRQAKFEIERNVTVMNAALDAESRRARIQAELDYLRSTFSGLLSRPVQAILTDEQFAHLSGLVSGTLESLVKRPN